MVSGLTDLHPKLTTEWFYVSCTIVVSKMGQPPRGMTSGERLRSTLRISQATKNRSYRKYAEDMVVAIWKPVLRYDGTGSVEVTHSVMKSDDDDKIPHCAGGFPPVAGKNGPALKMTGAKLLPSAASSDE